jgi:ERCC4-type nuclease
MKHYSSIEEIKTATIDELTQIPEITHKAAENIYVFFHKES